MIRLIIFRFIESYFRHRWLYLLPIVLMGVMGLVYINSKDPEYVSKGTIYVQRESFLASLTSISNSNASIWLTPAQATINQIRELLATDAFVRAVIFKSDLEAKMDESRSEVEAIINEVRNSIWIYSLGDNQLQINASHENARVSYQIVNAVLESYIQWQVNAQRSQSEAAQVFFAEQIKIYEADLEAARQQLIDYLIANPEPIQGQRPGIELLEVERLQNWVHLTESRYISALEKEENARLAMAQIESDTRQTYTIIDAPRLPVEPDISLRQLATQAAIFLAVGGVLFLAAVVGGILLDRTFRFPIDVQYGVNLPVFAMIADNQHQPKWYQRLFRKSNPKRAQNKGLEAQNGADSDGTTDNEPNEGSSQADQHATGSLLDGQNRKVAEIDPQNIKVGTDMSV